MPRLSVSGARRILSRRATSDPPPYWALRCFWILLGAYLLLARGSCAASSGSGVFPVYVRAGAGGDTGDTGGCGGGGDDVGDGARLGSEARCSGCRGAANAYSGGIGDGGDGGAGAGAGATCGSSEEDACPDIRSALRAIPEDLPAGQELPELRLLPGLYTGDGNVFLGGPGDVDYPSTASNVGLVGWNSKNATEALLPTGETAAVAATAAVLSCEGRQSRNDSTSPTRGVWLSEGRLTRLANITVTGCPAGGVGVDMWSGDGVGFSPASLRFVTIAGNGEGNCERGGGLYATAAVAAAEDDGVFIRKREADETRERGDGSGPLLLTVSGCVIANNTAQLGGGIAVGPSSTTSSPSSLSSPATLVEIPPPHLADPGGGREAQPSGSGGGQTAEVSEPSPRNAGMPHVSPPVLLAPRSAGEGESGIVIDGPTLVSGNRATSGGGVWVSGMTVSALGGGVVVRGNIAGGMADGCGDEKRCGGRGGGVYVDGGFLHLRGVSFEGNRAEAHQTRDEYAKGGGLSARASLVDARGCSFVGNAAVAVAEASAGIGGGAYLDGLNATLSNCRFERNHAEGNDLFGQLASFGGGLATRGPLCLTNISDSSFVTNVAGKGGSGGGVWVEDGARAVLVRTELVNNTAVSSYTHKGAGGGVAVSASASLDMSDGCSLRGNVAGPEDVGASNPSCLSGEGGGIHSTGSGVTLEGVSLEGNRCETGALDAGCSGGALSVTGQAPSSAAAIAANTGGATFDGCLFQGNEARGAATNSVYSGAGQGGAVAIRFAFPTFTACNFSGNSAEGGGGAAPATGGAVLLFLSRGTAPADPSETPTFVNCVFEANRAGPIALEGGSTGDGDAPTTRRGEQGHGIGGAVAAIASSPLLVGCSFMNNTAIASFPSSGAGEAGARIRAPVSGANPSFGGAIVLTSDCSGTRLDNCTLGGNAAVNGMGGDLAVLAAPSGKRTTSLAAFTTAVLPAFSGDSEAMAAHSAEGDIAAEAEPEAVDGAKLGLEAGAGAGAGGAGHPSESRLLGLAAAVVDPKAVTATLSGCTFRPALPQRHPAVPWADGRSETEASPFLFVLDGGTVELLSPVVEAAGQAFVAQVNPPALTEGGESIVSHLRIVDELPSVATGDGDDGGSSRYRDGGAKLSIVSVGGKVSLVGHSGNDTIMTGTVEERESRKEAAFPVPRLAVQDLLLLGGQLLLEGSNGGHRGVTVKRSTRIRTTRVSAAAASTASTASAAAAAGCGGNGCSDDHHAPVRTVTGGYNMRSGSSSSSSVSGWKRLMPSRPAASANTSTAEDAAAEQGATGGGGDVDAVKLEMAGRADLGEAWEPKPFFLGTSLSQLFPSPPAAPEGEGPGARGEKHRRRTSGRSGEGDVVVFDAVLVELSGDSAVRGDLSLVQSSSVQVGPAGSLTVVGDAAIRKSPLPGDDNTHHSNVKVHPTNEMIDEDCVLQNAGVLSFPRGVSLTVAGGIEQIPTGVALVNLPPPLYLPSSAVSYEDQRPAEGRGHWGQHPLVIESGATRLGGAVNASAWKGGGESERVKINRKWPIVRLTSNDIASATDTSALKLRGPTGVSMKISMQTVASNTAVLGEGLSSGGDGSGWSGSGKEGGDDQQWELVVEAAFIECRSMLAYANLSLAGGPCQACLLNMECAWCGDDAHKGCVPIDDRPVKLGGGRRGEEFCQVDSCCPLGCNGVGECDFFSATCSCPWLYAGSSCAELSTRGAVALSLSLSTLVVVLLILACGRSSRRKQMEAVVDTLQELKRGLLSEADGSIGDDDSSVVSFGGGLRSFSIGGRGQLSAGGSGGGGGGAVGSGLSYQHMWPRDYIQDLQQNLALRDVMVSFSELELSRKIGHGAAGSVWRGSWRGAAVAVKVIRRPFHQAVELTGRDLEVFKKEAYLMTRLRHPNIVLIMGVTFAPPGHRITLDGRSSMSLSRRRELGFENAGAPQGSLCIVTELLSRGSLEDVIREGGLRTASYALILNLALQAARGMLYLHTHSPQIVHRDLKSSNLVVDEHWHVKVTDFGMSRFVPERVSAIAASASHTPQAAPLSSSVLSNSSSPAFASTPSAADVEADGDAPDSANPFLTPPDAGGSGSSRANFGQVSAFENAPAHATIEEGSGGGDESRDNGTIAGRTKRIAGKGDGKTDGGRWSLRGAARWGRSSWARGRGATPVGSSAGSSESAAGEDEGKGELGLTTNLGTIAWAAPEMLVGDGNRGEYTTKVDVYSFGVVLWELWERRRPFEDLRSRFDIADTVAAGGRPSIGRGCPPQYAALVRRCWHQDPARRPFFQDIVEDLEAELESVASLTEL